VPELEQLALDSPVAPAVIFSGQALDQRGHGVIDGRTPQAMGIGPLLSDQATMPAQDRARRNQAMPPQHLRQPADEGREDRAIRPIQARLRIGSAQHGNFVAQHQQLDVLGHRRATKQHQQVQQPDEDKVEQTQRHGARSCLLAKPANLPGQQRGPTSGTPQVYQRIRCGLRRGRHPDPYQSNPSTAGERDL
jgi:hypothetical protein